MGEDIPAEFITNIKTSLMGPLAGVGDTIWQGVVIPILLAICIDITRSGSGNVWGSIIYAVLIVGAAYGLSYANFMFGYRAGSEAIMDFLEKGTLNKILKGASVMKSKGRLRKATPYLFISPWMVGFLVFTLGPLVLSLIMDLSENAKE